MAVNPRATPKTPPFPGLADAGCGGRRSTGAFRSCILGNLKKRAQHPLRMRAGKSPALDHTVEVSLDVQHGNRRVQPPSDVIAHCREGRAGDVQDGSLHLVPDLFDRTEIRAVRREEFELDLAVQLLERLPDDLGLVLGRPVQDHHDRLAEIRVGEFKAIRSPPPR